MCLTLNEKRVGLFGHFVVGDGHKDVSRMNQFISSQKNKEKEVKTICMILRKPLLFLYVAVPPVGGRIKVRWSKILRS